MADKTFLDSVGLQQVLKELSTKIKNTFVKKTALSKVAFTGEYNDLNNKLNASSFCSQEEKKTLEQDINLNSSNLLSLSEQIQLLTLNADPKYNTFKKVEDQVKTIQANMSEIITISLTDYEDLTDEFKINFGLKNFFLQSENSFLQDLRKYVNNKQIIIINNNLDNWILLYSNTYSDNGKQYIKHFLYKIVDNYNFEGMSELSDNDLTKALLNNCNFGTIIQDFTKTRFYFCFTSIDFTSYLTNENLGGIDGYSKRFTPKDSAEGTLLGYPTAPDYNTLEEDQKTYSSIITYNFFISQINELKNRIKVLEDSSQGVT